MQAFGLDMWGVCPINAVFAAFFSRTFAGAPHEGMASPIRVLTTSLPGSITGKTRQMTGLKEAAASGAVCYRHSDNGRANVESLLELNIQQAEYLFIDPD